MPDETTTNGTTGWMYEVLAVIEETPYKPGYGLNTPVHVTARLETSSGFMRLLANALWRFVFKDWILYDVRWHRHWGGLGSVYYEVRVSYIRCYDAGDGSVLRVSQEDRLALLKLGLLPTTWPKQDGPEPWAGRGENI